MDAIQRFPATVVRATYAMLPASALAATKTFIHHTLSLHGGFHRNNLVLRHTEDEGWPVRLDIPQGVEAYVQQMLAALEGRNEHDQHSHHSRSH